MSPQTKVEVALGMAHGLAELKIVMEEELFCKATTTWNNSGDFVRTNQVGGLEFGHSIGLEGCGTNLVSTRCPWVKSVRYVESFSPVCSI